MLKFDAVSQAYYISCPGCLEQQRDDPKVASMSANLAVLRQWSSVHLAIMKEKGAVSNLHLDIQVLYENQSIPLTRPALMVRHSITHAQAVMGTLRVTK